MPNFAQLQVAFKNAFKSVYVRIALAALLGVIAAVAIWKSTVSQDPSPVVHSQNIAEITQLAAKKRTPGIPLDRQAAVGVAALRL